MYFESKYGLKKTLSKTQEFMAMTKHKYSTPLESFKSEKCKICEPPWPKICTSQPQDGAFSNVSHNCMMTSAICVLKTKVLRNCRKEPIEFASKSANFCIKSQNCDKVRKLNLTVFQNVNKTKTIKKS